MKLKNAKLFKNIFNEIKKCANYLKKNYKNNKMIKTVKGKKTKKLPKQPSTKSSEIIKKSTKAPIKNPSKSPTKPVKTTKKKLTTKKQKKIKEEEFEDKELNEELNEELDNEELELNDEELNDEELNNEEINEEFKLDLNEEQNKEIENSISVIIEQQPRTNMKTIRMASQIIFFYAMKKLENNKENFPITKIVGYSAKNKTKYYVLGKDEEPIPERIMKLKSLYSRRKQISIEHTKRILLKRPQEKEFMEFFLKHKKKDDLSDCYLQGLSYISRFGKNMKKGSIILSIDPGTINFSYCLIDVKTEKIIEWNVDSIVDNMRHSDEFNAISLYNFLNKKNIIKKRLLN